MDIACKTEKPQQIYLLGVDFNRPKTPMNQSIDDVWKQEFKSCFQRYPSIEFIYVNNGKVEEWKDIDNINYSSKEY